MSVAQTSCRPNVCRPLPQIQKLADRSDVISEVQKCPKIQIFRPGSPGGAYNPPQNP